MKLYKHPKEQEIYHYFNAKGEKLWMFRDKFYDSTGKRKEKKKSGFTTEKAALKALLEVKAATLRGDTKHIENDNMTVSQWLDIWFEANKNKWKPTTIHQRESIIRLRIKPLIGSFKLTKLNKITYQKAFINVLEKDYEPSTVKISHRIFSIAINAAVEDEILPRNKIRGISLPSERQKLVEKKFLTPQKLKTFLDYAKDNLDISYYAAYLTIAYTGIRKGEAMGLQWRDIDFENRTISIARNRGEFGLGSTKTVNSERTIKVDELLIQHLRAYQKTLKPVLLSFGKKLKEDSFVFLSIQSGEPLTAWSLSHFFNKTIQGAGLPKTTIHGLRHTHCTILLNNGIPVKAIAERLGNTPEMIHTIYGHILKELEDVSVSVFTSALETSGAITGVNQQ